MFWNAPCNHITIERIYTVVTPAALERLERQATDEVLHFYFVSHPCLGPCFGCLVRGHVESSPQHRRGEQRGGILG